MRKLYTSAALAAVLACFASETDAALVVSTESQTSNTSSLSHNYTVSASDLVNGFTPTASAGNFGMEGTGGLSMLTNGTFTSPITRAPSPAFQFSTFATGGNTGGTSLTYSLTTPSNLTGIAVYGGWQDGGRDQQSYSVSYATEIDPSTFVLIGAVNFNPAAPSAGNFPQVTRVTLASDVGFLAPDVKFLKFDFGTTENGYSGYAEIDVFGAPIPEPASAGLLAVGASLTLLRRRRLV